MKKFWFWRENLNVVICLSRWSSLDFNFDIRENPTFKVIKYETPPSDENEKDKKDQFEPPVISELYIVSGNEVLQFFKDCGIQKGCGMSPQDVREVVRNYVNKNGLQNLNDKTVVNLDPVLAQAVLVKGENNVITIKWDKITSR